DGAGVLDRRRGRRRWSIRLKATPDAKAVPGFIDHIGDIIDPNQHTALLQGRVANADRRLRVGQFITAAVDLPPRDHEVEVPVAALLEDGTDSVVFVASPTEADQYTLRRVSVARRLPDAACLGSGLKGNERVVCDGALVLKAALDDLKGSAK